MINSTALEIFDNNEYQQFCSAAQLEKDLNVLKGIMMGITSDKVVNNQEISLVTNWIHSVRHYENNFPYKIFIQNLKKVIEDNIITDEEEKDIIWLCNQYLKKDKPYYDIITSATQTLTGILSGIVADGLINEDELDFLNSWLDENLMLRNTWLFDDLYLIVKEIVIEKEIKPDLLYRINKIAENLGPGDGSLDNSKLIENIKLDTEKNDISIDGMSFCITGLSLYNTRKDIVEMIESNGGIVVNTVSSKTDYLLICDEKNTCWTYTNYGRKVEKALELQKKKKSKIAIVYEIDFYKFLENIKNDVVQEIDIAEELALKFSDESDIPARLKKSSKKESSRKNANSFLEKRFQYIVNDWRALVNFMYEKIDSETANRLLKIKPLVEENLEFVSLNQDFLIFTDYLIFRRDKIECSDRELGLLSMLHTAFQKEIEKRISAKR